MEGADSSERVGRPRGGAAEPVRATGGGPPWQPDARAADMPDPLPIVDLDKLSTADEAAKLRSALQTWGLFLVRSIPFFFFFFFFFFFSLSVVSYSVPMHHRANLAPSLPPHACNGYLCAMPCRLPTMA